MLLPEVLLLLSGHPSALFRVVGTADSTSTSSSTPASPPFATWTYEIDPSIPGIHPGEVASLNALASIAAAYTRVISFANAQLARAKLEVLRASRGKAKETRQTKLMAPLCATLLDVLKDYRTLILDTEADVLRHDSSLTDLASLRDDLHNRGGNNHQQPFLSLSSIRARFAPWETSLGALDALVLALLRGPVQPGFTQSSLSEATHGTPSCPPCPTWSSGLLLDMLSTRAHTGIGLVASHLTRLLVACEDYWKRGLVAWMCHGEVEPASTAAAFEPLIEWHEGGDDVDEDAPPLAPDEGTGWRFVRNALPQSVSEDAALTDAILSVGRALSLLSANQRTTRSLPPPLVASHAARLSSSDVRPSRPTSFRRAVMEVREEVGEWMWRNVLTPASVVEAIEALGGYFLHRRGLFVSSLLQELSSLRRHKLLTATSAAGATLQASDVELALYRASLGTDAEDDAHLELCKVVTAPKRRGPTTEPRFDDLALGPSFSLSYTAHFPLDLFLTPQDLRNYSAIFSYLLAIRGAQARLRGCWMDMSKKQRLRRRFTGTGEGGANREEERERGELLRMAWGTAREALWFLEALGGHFQTDIIDVQFSRLKDQLAQGEEGASDVETESHHKSSLPASPEKKGAALARIRSGPSRPPSLAGTWKPRLATSRSTPAPDSALDFASIRAVHSSYLAFVLDGLLLTSPAATSIVRKVLEICDRFVGMVERWGGDVLPDLLMEGSIVGQEDTGKSVRERTAKIQEVAQVLRSHLDDFFSLLSSAFEGGQSADATVLDASLGSLSVLHPTRTRTLAGPTERARAKANEARLDADSAARRHLEQLLLRLDWNDFLGKRAAK